MRLQVTGCIDEDFPLSYRFGIFASDQIMMQDIKESLNGLNLNYLSSYGDSNILDTILPAS